MAPHNTDTENKIFNKISNNDTTGAKSYFSHHKIKPDIYDKHGMTLLQHAAFKGNKELVQFFLDQGADVNFNKHEYDYSTLHFAALSAKTEICLMILDSGAKIDATNNVGRTASQMAAFIGNHSCAALINNYVPSKDLEYYTKLSGLESEPKVQGFLVLPLHNFILEINMNPVKIIMNIKRFNLYDYLEKIKCILELLREKEMKKNEMSEILLFKFHYLGFLVSETMRCKKMLESQDDPKKIDPVEFFVKKLLKDVDYRDGLLRECVREFPYRECTIFHQMVASLSRNDSPNALTVVTSIINGQHFVDEKNPTCCACAEEKQTKKCSNCKSAQYCDKECQRLHWFMHKKYCKKTESS